MVTPQSVPTTNQTSQTDARVQETCCANTSRYLQIFQSTFNWPNSVPMQVSRKLLKKGSTLRGLMTQNLTDWKDHVESRHCFQVINHLNWKDGSVETWRSVQFWVWSSVTSTDVTLLKWKSNPNLGDKTCSWVRIVNGINKHVTERQKRFTLKVLERREQGKLVVKARPRQTSN